MRFLDNVRPHPSPLPQEREKNWPASGSWVQGANIVSGNSHPAPVASQARHESVSPMELCASRNVVPPERGKLRPFILKLWHVISGTRPNAQNRFYRADKESHAATAAGAGRN